MIRLLQVLTIYDVSNNSYFAGKSQKFDRDFAFFCFGFDTYQLKDSTSGGFILTISIILTA